MIQIFKIALFALLFFPILELWAVTPSRHKYGVILGPLSTASRTSDITASTGAVVFDTDFNALFVYYDGAWHQVGTTTPASTTFVLNFTDSSLVADVYTLTGGNTYTPAAGDALLWRNGLLQRVGTDYSETSTTSLTMTDYTPDASDRYIFMKFETDASSFLLTFGNSDLSSDIYTLTGGNNYTPGSYTALLFRNGLLQRPGTDYTETSSSTLTMTDYTPDASDLYSLVQVEQTAGFFHQEFANSDLVADVYTLTGGESYTTGSNDIAVFRNGNLLTVDFDYTETSSTTITIIDYTPDSGDLYVVRKF